MKTKSTVLTKEERDILILGTVHPRGKHLSNNEIAQRLGIPVSKVKNLIHQACVKLGAHSRNEAGFFALIRGDISINELYSLNELAQILSSLSPDTLRRIAHIVRQDLAHGLLSGKDEHIVLGDRRQNSVLTQRERDVLILVCRGLTNKEIADRLYISLSAVRTFLNRACTKLGASSRDNAVVLALKQGEISVGEILSLNEVVQGLAPLGAESIERIAQLLHQKLGQKPNLQSPPPLICPVLGVQCSALAANITTCSLSYSR
jgi:DNA-binding CsgD family transcriptional regulator